MGFGSRAFLAGGLGFAAAFAVACGGSNGLLSADQSSTLSSRLDAISAAVGSHNCGAAGSASAAFNSAVASLPPTVSTKLVQNLGQGAVTVSQLASRDCSSTTAKTTSSTTASASSTTSSTPAVTSSGSATTTQTATAGTGTATNPAPPGTSTTTNGGASLGTGTAGSGRTGQ